MSDVQGTRQLNARLESIKGRYLSAAILREWQMRTVAGAKRKAPKRTGNLQRSIHAGMMTKTEAAVNVSAGYAAYVEYGTRPHRIVPRFAKVLAWGGARRLTGSLRKGATATNFARAVQHPGTSPRPFLRPAASEALEATNLAAKVVKQWNDAA